MGGTSSRKPLISGTSKERASQFPVGVGPLAAFSRWSVGSCDTRWCWVSFLCSKLERTCFSHTVWRRGVEGVGFGARGYQRRRPGKFVSFLSSCPLWPGNPALHTSPSSLVYFFNARIQLASGGREAPPYSVSIPGDFFHHLPSLSARSNVNKSKMALVDIRDFPCGLEIQGFVKMTSSHTFTTE